MKVGAAEKGFLSLGMFKEGKNDSSLLLCEQSGANSVTR